LGLNGPLTGKGQDTMALVRNTLRNLFRAMGLTAHAQVAGHVTVSMLGMDIDTLWNLIQNTCQSHGHLPLLLSQVQEGRTATVVFCTEQTVEQGKRGQHGYRLAGEFALHTGKLGAAAALQYALATGMPQATPDTCDCGDCSYCRHLPEGTEPTEPTEQGTEPTEPTEQGTEPTEPTVLTVAQERAASRARARARARAAARAAS
jgi:hypothetical protein